MKKYYFIFALLFFIVSCSMDYEVDDGPITEQYLIETLDCIPGLSISDTIHLPIRDANTSLLSSPTTQPLFTGVLLSSTNFSTSEQINLSVGSYTLVVTIGGQDNSAAFSSLYAITEQGSTKIVDGEGYYEFEMVASQPISL